MEDLPGRDGTALSWEGQGGDENGNWIWRRQKGWSGKAGQRFYECPDWYEADITGSLKCLEVP